MANCCSSGRAYRPSQAFEGHLKYSEFPTCKYVGQSSFGDIPATDSDIRAWPDYGYLLAFFRKPHLTTIQDPDVEYLSRPRPITVIDGRSRKKCQIRFLRIPIVNDGRALADGCRVYLELLKRRDQEVHSILTWTLRWQEEFTKTTFRRSELQRSVVSTLPERANLERGPGLLSCILFTLDCDKIAYLVSVRPDAEPITFQFGEDIEVLLAAVMPHYDEQPLGSYRISIGSWDQISIRPITLMSRLGGIFRHQRR
jgi:hypothetical protein